MCVREHGHVSFYVVLCKQYIECTVIGECKDSFALVMCMISGHELPVTVGTCTCIYKV